MTNIIKFITVLFLLTTTLYSAPARGGLITFTQPDGTTFKGLLKGDASFHWIESNGEIVMLNPKDHYFYNAKISKEGSLELTTQKPMNFDALQRQAPQSASVYQKAPAHNVDKSSREALSKLYKASKQGPHPR